MLLPPAAASSFCVDPRRNAQPDGFPSKAQPKAGLHNQTTFQWGTQQASAPALRGKSNHPLQLFTPPPVETTPSPTMRWLSTTALHRAGCVELPASWLQASSTADRPTAYRSWVGDHVEHTDWQSLYLAKIAFNQQRGISTRLYERILQGMEHVTVEPVSMLAAYLLAIHHAQHGRTSYSEFAALVYEKGGKLLVLYQDSAQPAASTNHRTLQERATEAEKRGWKLRVHLHNHPFNFNNAAGDFGGRPAPSTSDLKTFARLAHKTSSPSS